MTRFLKRTLFCLVPATVAALVLGVPPAAPDLGLQSVGLSCSDGTALNLSLSMTELIGLADAVSAINLDPAGDPPLACGLTGDPPPSSANGPKDYAVGGGQVMNFLFGTTNFSLSAHSVAEAPPTPPQQGVGGTYNVSVPSGFFRGSFTSKVDCVKVGDDDGGTGRAQATAVVTHAEGFFASFTPPGTEVRVDVFDSGMPGPAPANGDMIGASFSSGPCDFSSGGSYCSGLFPCSLLLHGNIDVHDQPS